MVRTGATFAEVAEEFMRYVEHDRELKPSTLRGYRSHLMAAFTGLRRGELLALRWRDVDFVGSLVRVRASYAGGALRSPKSGKVRSVPLAPEVAEVLGRLSQRVRLTGDDDLVFLGDTGSYLDGS